MPHMVLHLLITEYLDFFSLLQLKISLHSNYCAWWDVAIVMLFDDGIFKICGINLFVLMK